MVKLNNMVFLICLISIFILCISSVSATDMDSCVLDEGNNLNLETNQLSSEDSLDLGISNVVDDQLSAEDSLDLGSSNVVDDQLSTDGEEQQLTNTQIKCDNVVTYTKYDGGKNLKTIYVTLCDDNGNGVPYKNIKWSFKGKTYTSNTNSKGVASLKVNVPKSGTYAVKVSFGGDDSYYSISKSFKITVKDSIDVKAPSKKFLVNKKNFFKVTVKNYKGKALKYTKVKLKVFTGKKYKIYALKTNKYGVVKLNTKKLKKGSHKVTVYSGNKKYKFSKSSKIVIYNNKHVKTFKIGEGEYTKNLGYREYIDVFYSREHHPQLGIARGICVSTMGDSYKSHYKIYKFKIYYKNNAKIQISTYKTSSGGKIVQAPKSYKPYKIKVYYISSSKAKYTIFEPGG